MRDLKKLVNFTKDEQKLFGALNTPAKIQDYLNSFAYKHSKLQPTLHSPRHVLLTRSANCIEGALLAATALWYQGCKPLLLDLVSSSADLDHVVALFKWGEYWGAVSKTNHVVLRYREPVYKSVRELAMSYFHEYFLDNGKKTLRAYSNPYDLSLTKDVSWITSGKDLWDIAEQLDASHHHKILTPTMIKHLRFADRIERDAGKLTEW